MTVANWFSKPTFVRFGTVCAFIMEVK